MRSITGSTFLVFVLLSGAASVAGPTSAEPYTDHVLKNFCETHNCPPTSPASGLLLGDDGNLYGVAGSDVFAMTPDGSGGWSYQTIAAGMAAGNYRAPLIRDAAGNLYGTGQNQIFRLTPNADHTAWTTRILATFCTQTNCPDGGGLVGGLSYAGSASGAPYDGTSALFGTASHGGAHGDQKRGGVIYSLIPGSGDTWTKMTLYDFCARSGCSDGASPLSGVVVDGSGNLYGTTNRGGNTHNSDTYGTVFKLTWTGSKWSESVLHKFCSLVRENGCPDGFWPFAGVTIDGAGNIFGNTQVGGRKGGGVIFQLRPIGEKYRLRPIYAFGAKAYPVSSMTLGPSGELYGTTAADGNLGHGTVYKLTPQSEAWTQSTIYTFCTLGKCKDGANPGLSTLLLDGAGNLFGTTNMGGSRNGGTVFELTP